MEQQVTSKLYVQTYAYKLYKRHIIICHIYDNDKNHRASELM